MLRDTWFLSAYKYLQLLSVTSVVGKVLTVYWNGGSCKGDWCTLQNISDLIIFLVAVSDHTKTNDAC